MTAPVVVAVDDQVAVVTLNRPEVRNALSAEVVSELGAAISSLDRDDGVAAIVLTGADPAFCAGFDLRQLATELRDVMGPGPKVPAGQPGLLPAHGTPVIGAVNGAAVTGGLELCLSCDFLIASERARFADTHARVGAMPGAGLTVRLPELIGPDRARRMSFTGDFVGAQQAYEWGLVTEVVPHDQLLDRARAVAATIASIPGANVREVRRMYDEMAQLSGPAAWERENELARRWMASRFDATRLAAERHAIIQRGARPGVRVYAGMDPRLALADVPAHARRVEALGYDGLHVAETVHDALAVALLAIEHTERMVVRTAVTLAFPRSPTLTAYAAWDLAVLSAGRFQLGLGTQIRQNIEDRYSVTWSEPVARMREYLGALSALFESFRTGGGVAFEGEHYQLRRMQPYFNPGPDPSTGAPPLWLGGVNPGICRLAGEVADGFVTHPTNSSPRYLEAICLPNLRIGAERAGRALSDIELVVGTQVITGATPDELDTERERQRRLFAFLYSTPAYRPTLELYGWEDLAGRLQAMVREDRWGQLHALVSDEVLDTLVPTAGYDQLPGVLAGRFGALGQGVLVPVPADPAHDTRFTEVLAAIGSAA